MKKFMFGLMALIMCVVAFSLSSCSADSKLKKTAEAMKPNAETGLTKATYDEASHTFEFDYEYPAEALAAGKASYDANPEQYAAWYLYTQKDVQSMKDLAKLLVSAKGSLKIVMSAKGGSDKVELTYNTDQLQKLVDGTLEAAEQPQPQVQQQGSEEENVEGTEEGATDEEATGEEGSEEGGEEEGGEEAAE